MELALRRTLLWTFAGIALAALLMAAIVTAMAPDSALAWLVGSLVVLALALTGEVVVLFIGEQAHPPRKAPGAAAAGAQRGPAAAAGDDLLLRCSACDKTYTAFDDGKRPLATLCPHCGQRGVIDAPAA